MGMLIMEISSSKMRPKDSRCTVAAIAGGQLHAIGSVQPRLTQPPSLWARKSWGNQVRYKKTERSKV